MNSDELLAVNSAINYRTIADYACSLRDPREASVISDMMCRLALRSGLCVGELNDSIFRIDRLSMDVDVQEVCMDTSEQDTVGSSFSGTDYERFADAPCHVLRHYDSRFVIDTIRAMGSQCHEAWHYACLMAVCDDHGLLMCRTQLTEFVRMLVALGIVEYTDDYDLSQLARNIGRTIRRLPLGYREWGDELNLFRCKCISLADCLDETTPYRSTARAGVRSDG